MLITDALASVGPEAVGILFSELKQKGCVGPLSPTVTRCQETEHQEGQQTQIVVYNCSDGSEGGILQSPLRPRSSYRLRN